MLEPGLSETKLVRVRIEWNFWYPIYIVLQSLYICKENKIKSVFVCITRMFIFQSTEIGVFVQGTNVCAQIVFFCSQ